MYSTPPYPPLRRARVCGVSLWLIAGLCVGLSLGGCVAHRDLVNFNDARLPDGLEEAIENARALSIQPNDLLRITVNSFDVAAAAPFNIEAPGGTPAGGGGPGQFELLQLFSGYYVDESGGIDFPVLGRLAVAGETTEQLEADIKERLERYLKEPVVNVRFLNAKVTLMGSVAAPGVINVTNQRVTLLEALAKAGGLTDYADRGEVLVVREEAGRRSYAYLDLHTDEVFTSPYFYLQQNDFIYVKPLRARTAAVADPGQRIVQYASGIISVAALTVALFLNGGN